MTEAKPEEQRGKGLSLEETAKALGVDAERVKVLAGQGRLTEGGTPDNPRYDLDSVLSMQAEDLIREMLEDAGDKRPELRAKIDTLAMLQYQRGREGDQRAEHWEILERLEKVSAERQEFLEELRELNEKANAERQAYLEELRELDKAAERRNEDIAARMDKLLETKGWRLRDTG